MKIWLLALLAITPLFGSERITAERAIDLLSKSKSGGDIISGIYEKIESKEDFQEYIKDKGFDAALEASTFPMKLVHAFSHTAPRFISMKTLISIGFKSSLSYPDYVIKTYAVSFYIDSDGHANPASRFESVIAIYDSNERETERLSTRYHISQYQVEKLKVLFTKKTEPNQSLVPTTTAVTPPASQEPRQPRSRHT